LVAPVAGHVGLAGLAAPADSVVPVGSAEPATGAAWTLLSEAFRSIDSGHSAASSRRNCWRPRQPGRSVSERHRGLFRWRARFVRHIRNSHSAAWHYREFAAPAQFDSGAVAL